MEATKMGKIDIHNVGREVKKLNASIKDQDLKEFIQAKQIGKFGKKIGDHQESKYIRFIRTIHKWMGKPFQELTEEDTTNFYTKLSNNEILKEDKTPYTNESKNSYIRVFKTYMRYLSEVKYKNLNYEVLAKWMKDFDEDVKIAALTKDEVMRLAEVNSLIAEPLPLLLPLFSLSSLFCLSFSYPTFLYLNCLF